MILKKFFLVSVITFNTQLFATKILHLSFHKGCIENINKVIESLKKDLDIELTTFFVHSKPVYDFDGITRGNDIYNITRERASNVWMRHKDYFNQFDVILTSDTAPLSRIFLQNGWSKPLIIWICNRFDYADLGSARGLFPDTDYYKIFKEALDKPNVFIIPYSVFETIYAKSKGINLKQEAIKPLSYSWGSLENSAVNVDKKHHFFIPDYVNNKFFINLYSICSNLGIPVYRGRYNGPADIADFKGVINIPGAWCNTYFFENITNGLPTFVPTKRFLLELISQNRNYFMPDAQFLFNYKLFDFNEWYNPENSDCIIYFDSWKDLKNKIKTTNFESKKIKIKEFAKKHNQKVLSSWLHVFNEAIKKL